MEMMRMSFRPCGKNISDGFLLDWCLVNIENSNRWFCSEKIIQLSR
jgi:hypothetical protein